MIADRKAFIRANTRLKPVPLVPEISLYVADEAVPIWQKTEEELDAMGLPPPYWAFAWAGGQALARYVLDHRARSRACACSISRPAPGWSRSPPHWRAPRRSSPPTSTRSPMRRSRSTPRRTTSTSRSSRDDLLDRPASRRAALRRHPGRRPVLRARHRRAGACLPRPPRRDRRARAGRRSRPHLSAEGPAHAACRILRAGDARAGGHGDQANGGVGVAVAPNRRVTARKGGIRFASTCLLSLRLPSLRADGEHARA